MASWGATAEAGRGRSSVGLSRGPTRDDLNGRADRHEPSRQEGSQREGVPWRHFCDHDLSRPNVTERFSDKSATESSVPHRRRHLDVHLVEAAQAASDRDNASFVAVDDYIVSERAGVLHPRVIVLIVAHGQCPPAPTLGHEHDVVAPDGSCWSGQPE